VAKPPPGAMGVAEAIPRLNWVADHPKFILFDFKFFIILIFFLKVN
jgi:hypothetical protein